MSHPKSVASGLVWTLTVLASAGPDAMPPLAPAAEIYVVQNGAVPGQNGVFRIDAAGMPQAVSIGGYFSNPNGIAVSAGGDILVADSTALGSGAVIRVDPASGLQTIVSSGGHFTNPNGLALTGEGTIVVSNDVPFAADTVIAVSPASGVQSILSGPGILMNSRRVAVGPDGAIYVADTNSIVRVDPSTGAQTVASSSASFAHPYDLAFEANGLMLVADRQALGGAIFRVDPASGAPTLVSYAGSFSSTGPVGVAVTADGDILVVDADAFGGGGGVIRVDPATGGQQVVASGGAFVSPVAIAVSPAKPTRPVEIDIKPGSSDNTLNLESSGVIPVAILGSATFDPSAVDPESVTLAGARVRLNGRSGRYSCAPDDVNGDGRADLVCHVITDQLELQVGETIAVLEAETYSGEMLRGADSIRIISDITSETSGRPFPPAF